MKIVIGGTLLLGVTTMAAWPGELTSTNRTVGGVSSTKAEVCRDRIGRFVPNGEYFVPDDPCRMCLCSGGVPDACTLMQCSRPDCEQFVTIKGECCAVQCVQVITKNVTDSSLYDISKYSDSASLGLRLLASGATSLLILIVLLYMIHHLRHRRVLASFRAADSYLSHREDASSDVCRFDRIDVSISLPSFEVVDLPPPYSPPKPIYFPPTYEEAPPPYEATMLEIPTVAAANSRSQNSP